MELMVRFVGLLTCWIVPCVAPAIETVPFSIVLVKLVPTPVMTLPVCVT